MGEYVVEEEVGWCVLNEVQPSLGAAEVDL